MTGDACMNSWPSLAALALVLFVADVALQFYKFLEPSIYLTSNNSRATCRALQPDLLT